MKVLSLFDGISCGRLALEWAGIQVEKYFASEIDKYAICIAKKNYPDTIHIGDIRKVRYMYMQWSKEDRWYWLLWEPKGWLQDTMWKIDKFDLLIWGSPCQNLSRAGNKKWLQWERSGLFFEFVRILKQVKPQYFLFENVASMKNSNKEIITNTLKEIFPDTKCYMINSSLVSAQNRKRYYWTNIPNIVQPEDKNILLQDILQPQYDWENTRLYAIKQKARGFNAGNIFTKKSPTLTSCSWEHNNHIVNVNEKEIIRKLTPIECERLQTLPDNYTAWLSNSQRYRVIGNSWTVDVIAHILSFLK